MTDAEHNKVLLVLVTYWTVIFTLGFLWERHKKYRDYYRRRNHPTMKNK